MLQAQVFTESYNYLTIWNWDGFEAKSMSNEYEYSTDVNTHICVSIVQTTSDQGYTVCGIDVLINGWVIYLPDWPCPIWTCKQ